MAKATAMIALIYVILIWILCDISDVIVISEAICQDALGMANGKIEPGQISTSSNIAAHITGNRARLYGDRAWRAASSANESIEVDFGQITNVTALSVQGNPNVNQNEYVTKYRVAYSLTVNESEVSWVYLKDENHNKMVFQGNNNLHTPVYHEFASRLYLRRIRLDAIECNNRCALRLEFYGCRVLTECQEALGMANGFIRDDQISASTSSNITNRARLYGDRTWRATSNVSEWIEVDFGDFVNVTALAMQGNPFWSDIEYVTKYKVAYSVSVNKTQDGWVYVKAESSSNEPMVFSGNSDQYSPVFQLFPSPLYLRHIRIDTMECKRRCSLRLELYGCKNTGQIEFPFQAALGMSNGLIRDDQLLNSSVYDSHAVNRARLYGDRDWRTQTRSNEWIEVDFENVVQVTALSTQGNPNYKNYVIKYKVAYRIDNSQAVWMNVTDSDNNYKEFLGNNNPYTPAFQELPNPVHLRYIRVDLLECNLLCGLRIEFYGFRDLTTTSNEITTDATTNIADTSDTLDSTATSNEMTRTDATTNIADTIDMLDHTTPGYVVGSAIGGFVIIVIFVALAVWIITRRKRSKLDSTQGMQLDGPNELTVEGEHRAPASTQAVISANISNRTNGGHHTDSEGNNQERRPTEGTDEDYSYINSSVKADVDNLENSSEMCDDNAVHVTAEERRGSERSNAASENNEEGWEVNCIYDTTDASDQNRIANDQTEGWEENIIYAENN